MSVVRLVLVFSPPVDSQPDRGVEFPLYQCDEATECRVEADFPVPPADGTLSVKGFCFLKRTDAEL